MSKIRLNDRKIIIFLISFLLILALSVVALFVWYPYYPPKPTIAIGPNEATGINQATHVARGTGVDAARVDSQITLKIPSEQVDAVYQYLKDAYVGKDGLLKDQFPSAHLRGQTPSDVSVFTDVYYDTPALDLYNNQNSARYRFRVNTTNPDDRKSGRELVQLKVTPPGQFDTRSEIKYDVMPLGDLKNGIDDAHPLIRLIKKNKREEFKNIFLKANIDPYSLREILTLQQTRSRVYINWDDTNIISFSVDHGGSSILWATSQFSSVDVGLVEIAYTEADVNKRKIMWDIRDAMVKDLTDHFPALTATTDSKYGIVLDGLIKQIHVIPLLIKYKII